MEQLQNRSAPTSVYCGCQVQGTDHRLCEYIALNNCNINPLNDSQGVVIANEEPMSQVFQPEEELEDDIFSDCEGDSSAQNDYAESDEQVVPSSQLSNSHKYPDEDLTISDNEEDEGIFEDDQTIDDLTSDDLILLDTENRQNSQPP